jgi:ammonia channel protein AmtB
VAIVSASGFIGLVGALIIGVLAFVATALLLLALQKLPSVGLRVSEAEEALGLDRAVHGEEGYRL